MAGYKIERETQSFIHGNHNFIISVSLPNYKCCKIASAAFIQCWFSENQTERVTFFFTAEAVPHFLIKQTCWISFQFDFSVFLSLHPYKSPEQIVEHDFRYKICTVWTQ